MSKTLTKGILCCFVAILIAIASLPFLHMQAYADDNGFKYENSSPIKQYGPISMNYSNGANPINYIYTLQYNFESTFLVPHIRAKSTMYVKNVNRSVGANAMMAQAGITIKRQSDGYEWVYQGPTVWNTSSNAAGKAIMSRRTDTMYTGQDSYAWGNGFVRDPQGNYHHCPTDNHWIDGTA